MSNTINYVPAPDSVLLMARTIEEKIGAIFKPTQALEKEIAKANQEFFQIIKTGETIWPLFWLTMKMSTQQACRESIN